MFIPGEYKGAVDLLSYLVDIQGRRFTYPIEECERKGIQLLREALLKNSSFGPDWVKYLDGRAAHRQLLRQTLIKQSRWK